MNTAAYNKTSTVINTLGDTVLGINDPYYEDATSLMLAAKNNIASKVIIALLEAGTGINSEDHEYWKLLAFPAEFYKNLIIINTLMTNGDKVNDREANDRTLLI
jgi:hypothetical protein